MTRASPLLTADHLADPARYECVPGIPIFKPHVRRTSDGRVKYTIAASDLYEIAATTQAAIDAGHFPRLTPGHVFPGVPDAELPVNLGTWANVRVEPFGPSREPAVVADLYFRRDQAAEAKRHPYRSAEYYPLDKRIRGLALLTRDPCLDLGTTLYSLDAGRVECYALENAMPDDLPVVAAAAPAALSDELYQAIVDRLTADGYVSASNGPAPDNNPVMLQLEQLRGEVRSQAKALAKQAHNQAVNTDAADLDRLEAEGYQLDRAHEAKTLAQLTGPNRAKYIANIRSHYSRVPSGTMVEVYQGPSGTPTGPRPLSQAEFDAAMAHMNRAGCSFDDAKAAVRKR